eukprot:SAG31_NODE_3061_length_4730_cov_16.996330_3_plen_78_part_00
MRCAPPTMVTRWVGIIKYIPVRVCTRPAAHVMASMPVACASARRAAARPADPEIWIRKGILRNWILHGGNLSQDSGS